VASQRQAMKPQKNPVQFVFEDFDFSSLISHHFLTV
jgi:hypothetical protein